MELQQHRHADHGTRDDGNNPHRLFGRAITLAYRRARSKIASHPCVAGESQNGLYRTKPFYDDGFALRFDAKRVSETPEGAPQPGGRGAMRNHSQTLMRRGPKSVRMVW